MKITTVLYYHREFSPVTTKEFFYLKEKQERSTLEISAPSFFLGFFDVAKDIAA